MTYSGDVSVGGPPDTRELPGLTVTKVAVGPMNNNAYLLRCTSTGELLLIDAANEAATLLALIGGTPLATIVTTHQHRDHWEALSEVQKATGAATIAHPQDASALGEFSGSAALRGVRFAHFAAFFSRAYRENDYLLGRIHALDRLIDIVCNSAKLDIEKQRSSVSALKVRGFKRILDAEEKFLPNSVELIARLRRSIAALARWRHGACAWNRRVLHAGRRPGGAGCLVPRLPRPGRR